MKKLVAALLIAALSGTASAAPRRTTTTRSQRTSDSHEDSLANLKRWMPAALQSWHEAMPDDLYRESTKWLTDFDGTASPIRAVTINGERRFIGSICKPGWCVNRAEVMIAPGRVAGIAHFETMAGAKSLMMIGSFQSGESACLERLLKEEPSATSC